MSGLETRLLERIRSKHEEIERLEQMVMKDLMSEELSPTEQLSQGHRLRSMTKSIILKTEKLVKTYEEKKDEIAEPLGGETEIWNAFSNRLKEIHEYYEKHPSGPPLVDYEELLVDAAAAAHDYGAPIEAKVKKLCNLFDEAINITKQLGEKQEMEEEQAMGRDGKPIPYWLNILGLGHEYKCEICKNHSYWGKGAFERHFQEWKHQWALGSLGILDRENKFNGIISIEEAKQVWKSQGGQCRDDKEIIKEKKNKSKKVVEFAHSTRWLENESLNIAKDELEFLRGSDSDYGFYLKNLLEYQVSPLTPYGDDDIESENEYTDPPLHQFTYTLPEGMTAKELDIIKLAAEFWARYERCFFVGFLKRMGNDPYFEFMMKKPNELNRCTLFRDLISAYVQVLETPPLEDLKEGLRNNAADMETILENCYHRLQWERFLMEECFVKKAREESAKRPRRELGRSIRQKY